MAMISIQTSKPPSAPQGFALFALGFRPFFLAAGLFAVISMALWLGMLMGAIEAPAGLAPPLWHGHEMLFGFTAAVIGGFLLTATQNWTSIPMPRGGPLALLFALWLAGRLAFHLPVPYAAAAAIDLLFLPVLMLAVLKPVLRVRQARNYPFPLMLLGLTATNAGFHAAQLGADPGLAPVALDLALYLVVLMMVVMGGRVIPYFTERRLDAAAKRWTAVEWLAPATALLLLAAVAASRWIGGAAVIALAAAAAVVHAVRLAGWQDRRLWRVPLLWVLHLGYGWIVAGFALDAFAAAGLVSPFLAMHAYATGGIGVLTLGMMARVSLGHTGRILEAPAVMAWAFAVINLSALVRVFGPLLFPSETALLYEASGMLWIAAFAVFAAVYAPMLWRPRVDGKPG